MVDQYWRRIESVKDEIENSLQISGVLLKLKEYDGKLGDIGTNETNISSNLGKIGTSETNISSNLGKISTNETNISSNLGKIGTNETNISSNLTKLNDMNMKTKKEIYEKISIISNMYNNFNTKKIADIYINLNFTTDGIIKINANYNCSYKNINKFRHLYKFFGNNSKFKEIILDHKIILMKH